MTPGKTSREKKRQKNEEQAKAPLDPLAAGCEGPDGTTGLFAAGLKHLPSSPLESPPPVPAGILFEVNL